METLSRLEELKESKYKTLLSKLQNGYSELEMKENLEEKKLFEDLLETCCLDSFKKKECVFNCLYGCFSLDSFCQYAAVKRKEYFVKTSKLFLDYSKRVNPLSTRDDNKYVNLCQLSLGCLNKFLQKGIKLDILDSEWKYLLDISGEMDQLPVTAQNLAKEILLFGEIMFTKAGANVIVQERIHKLYKYGLLSLLSENVFTVRNSIQMMESSFRPFLYFERGQEKLVPVLEEFMVQQNLFQVFEKRKTKWEKEPKMLLRIWSIIMLLVGIPRIPPGKKYPYQLQGACAKFYLSFHKIVRQCNENVDDDDDFGTDGVFYSKCIYFVETFVGRHISSTKKLNSKLEKVPPLIAPKSATLCYPKRVFQAWTFFVSTIDPKLWSSHPAKLVDIIFDTNHIFKVSEHHQNGVLGVIKREEIYQKWLYDYLFTKEQHDYMGTLTNMSITSISRSRAQIIVDSISKDEKHIIRLPEAKLIPRTSKFKQVVQKYIIPKVGWALFEVTSSNPQFQKGILSNISYPLFMSRSDKWLDHLLIYPEFLLNTMQGAKTAAQEEAFWNMLLEQKGEPLSQNLNSVCDLLLQNKRKKIRIEVLTKLIKIAILNWSKKKTPVIIDPQKLFQILLPREFLQCFSKWLPLRSFILHQNHPTKDGALLMIGLSQVYPAQFLELFKQKNDVVVKYLKFPRHYVDCIKKSISSTSPLPKILLDRVFATTTTTTGNENLFYKNTRRHILKCEPNMVLKYLFECEEVVTQNDVIKTLEQKVDCDSVLKILFESEELYLFEYLLKTLLLGSFPNEEGENKKNEESSKILLYPSNVNNSIGDDKKDPVVIYKGNLSKLDPNVYLSDNIIDLFGIYLSQNDFRDFRDQFYIFSSLFYSQEKLKPLARNYEYKNRRFWIIPINQSSHWTLLIVCNVDHFFNEEEEDKKYQNKPFMLLFDSLIGFHDGKEIEDRMNQFLLEVREPVSKKTKITKTVPLGILSKLPQQNSNDSNCGVFVCMFMEQFLSDVFKSKTYKLESLKKCLGNENLNSKEFLRGPNNNDPESKRKTIKQFILDLSKRYQESLLIKYCPCFFANNADQRLKQVLWKLWFDYENGNNNFKYCDALVSMYKYIVFSLPHFIELFYLFEKRKVGTKKTFQDYVAFIDEIGFTSDYENATRNNDEQSKRFQKLYNEILHSAKEKAISECKLDQFNSLVFGNKSNSSSSSSLRRMMEMIPPTFPIKQLQQTTRPDTISKKRSDHTKIEENEIHFKKQKKNGDDTYEDFLNAATLKILNENSTKGESIGHAIVEFSKLQWNKNYEQLFSENLEANLEISRCLFD